MSNEMQNIKLSPYIPNTIPKNKVYASTVGAWLPCEKDGKWPLHVFAFNRQNIENRSWYETCSIHEGLNPFMMYEIHSKDFLKLMGEVSVNTFKNFPVGKARHAIICNPAGKIMIDGIIIRRGEDDYFTCCLIDPQILNAMVGNKYKIQSRYVGETRFFFQLCGPKSLEILEQACKKDLHGLRFMYSEDAQIGGKDIFVLRTSMTGGLGYEVHGNIEDAHMIWEKLIEIGQAYGIQEIGAVAYMNQHAEGSIMQNFEHFISASPAGEGTVISGSIPRDSELIFRSPFDNGWGNLVKFDHEFVGKEALLAESQRPHNTAVHLIWNKEDVLKVMAGSMDPEKRYDYMDPYCDFDYVNNCYGIHIDAIYDGDKIIGASSGRLLCEKTLEMISICTIAEEYAVEGKEVEILWGNPGTNQVRIRAAVSLFPYLDPQETNAGYDVERIPHPVF